MGRLLCLSDEEYKARAGSILKRAGDACVQKLVNSGEAETLAEARRLRGKRANAAAAQKLVDSGEAGALAKARSLGAKRARDEHMLPAALKREKRRK